MDQYVNAVNLFKVVNRVDTGRFVTSDVLNNDEHHLQIANVVKGQHQSRQVLVRDAGTGGLNLVVGYGNPQDSNQDEFLRYLGIETIRLTSSEANRQITRAAEYLEKRENIRLGIDYLQKNHGISVRSTAPRLSYGINGTEDKHVAPILLIKVLEKEDMTLPEKLEQVLEKSFGVNNFGSSMEFNRNGQHKGIVDLLSPLGIVEDQGERAFRRTIHGFEFGHGNHFGIFASLEEYRQFLNDLHRIATSKQPK